MTVIYVDQKYIWLVVTETRKSKTEEHTSVQSLHVTLFLGRKGKQDKAGGTALVHL